MLSVPKRPFTNQTGHGTRRLCSTKWFFKYAIQKNIKAVFCLFFSVSDGINMNGIRNLLLRFLFIFIGPKDRMWALQRLRRILSTPGTCCDAPPAVISLESSENPVARSAVSSAMMSPRGINIKTLRIRSVLSPIESIIFEFVRNL
jgi:hypothetical protein